MSPPPLKSSMRSTEILVVVKTLLRSPVESVFAGRFRGGARSLLPVVGPSSTRMESKTG